MKFMSSLGLVAALVAGATGFAPRAAAQTVGGSGAGAASINAPMANALGWSIGSVTVAHDWVCINCVCAWTGTPTVTETLVAYECAVTSVTHLPVTCPATEDCPDGITGVNTAVVVECCLDYVGYGCSSFTFRFNTCSAP